MASIERTAYPRFKRRPSAQELTEVYTPSSEELVFIRAHARGPSPTLTVAVLLKSMQRLGYLPRLQDVPFARAVRWRTRHTRDGRHHIHEGRDRVSALWPTFTGISATPQ